MNVDFFIKQIAMNKDKDAYVASKLVKNYIPYEEKISECERIIEATSYIYTDDERIYRRNTPSRVMLLTLTLINKYTEIEIDFNNALLDYNKLEENGLSEEILNVIPQREIEIWNTLITMISDDIEDNTRSLAGFFGTKFDAISDFVAAVLSTMPAEENKQ